MPGDGMDLSSSRQCTYPLLASAFTHLPMCERAIVGSTQAVNGRIIKEMAATKPHLVRCHSSRRLETCGRTNEMSQQPRRMQGDCASGRWVSSNRRAVESSNFFLSSVWGYGLRRQRGEQGPRSGSNNTNTRVELEAPCSWANRRLGIRWTC